MLLLSPNGVKLEANNEQAKRLLEAGFTQIAKQKPETSASAAEPQKAKAKSSKRSNRAKE